MSNEKKYIPPVGHYEMEKAFGILEAALAKLCSEDDELPYWRVTVLGGAWTAAHKGSAFDAFRAAPKAGSEAESWAVAYHIGRLAQFHISLYGVGGSNDLAKAYAHKCQWFYNLWRSIDKGKYYFSEEDCSSYEAPSSLDELASTLSGRALTRARWLRDLWPLL